MPHSSGGGSHSGGSHSSHSSSHSSGGGSHSSGSHSSPVYSNKPFAGSHRFVYYRHNQPHYYYSRNTRPEPVSMTGRIITILFLSIFLLFTIPFWPTAVSVSRPISQPSDTTIYIQDNLDVIADETSLMHSLEQFRDETGVVPAVVTDDNSWQDYYSSLETYAYDLYVNQFADEKHWLIVYTSNSSTEFDDWHFEGMIGDDTSGAVSSRGEDILTGNMQKYLTARSKYDVGEAVANAFNDTLVEIQKPHVEWVVVVILALFCGFPLYFIIGEILGIISDKRYASGYRCPDKPVEVKCEYCGGTYIKDTHLNCPFCGAHLAIEINHDFIRKDIDDISEKKILMLPAGILAIVLISWIYPMLSAIKNITSAPESWISVIVVIPLSCLMLFSIASCLKPFVVYALTKHNGEEIRGIVEKINVGSSETAIDVAFAGDEYIRYNTSQDKHAGYKKDQRIVFKKWKHHYVICDDE